VPIDPFRVQFLTVALDSHVVLALVGVIVGGLTFGAAARRGGFLGFGAGTWWDIVTAAVIGGRAVWVAMHLDYYQRAPLQIVVLIDGGLSSVGLVLGVAFAIRGLVITATERNTWRSILELVALATLVTFAFERAGCALTTCGGGPPTDVGWALQRGEELRQPIAVYQTVILVAALVLATEVRSLEGQALPLTLFALGLVQTVALVWGGRGPDVEGSAALVLAAALTAMAWLTSATSRARPSTATMQK
jgi:prolipoprotein diacylglyceryltransferase